MPAHEPTLQWQLLEWVYDHEHETPNRRIALGPFAADHGLDAGAARSLLSLCEAQDLLGDPDPTLGELCASLTAKGREWVEGRLARRKNIGLRAKTTRTHLLIWLYQRNSKGRRSVSIGDFLHDNASYYEGERLTEREVDQAAGTLRERGLIRGIMTAQSDGPIRAGLTANGERCVEDFAGDVTEFEKAQQGGNVINNFGGDNKGIIANNSPGAHMTVTNNEAAQAEEVQRWVDSYRQSRPTMQLAVEAEAELEEIATDLESQVKANALDVSRARGGLQRARELLDSPLAAGLAANMLAAYAMQLVSTLH